LRFLYTLTEIPLVWISSVITAQRKGNVQMM